MARTSRPDSIYRVSLHRNGGHLYAATHPYTVDAGGRRRYSIIHWGTLDEGLRFVPGKRYREASDELRAKLIFPEGWDLSAITSPRGYRQGLAFLPGDEGKPFGHVWMLERISDSLGLHADLAEALGSATSADDLLTLAYFPLLTGTSYIRFQRWQASTKVPSNRSLEAMLEESLSGVSREALYRFMMRRLERYRPDRLCAVDSITRFSLGRSLADRRWGQKTERIHSHTAVEAVVYSLDAGVPVTYSSHLQAATDARGMGLFLSELKKVGLEGAIVVTDRGYDSLQGLERYYSDAPMLMCVDAKQPAVMERIQAFGRFREHPAGMRYDAASRRWYRQYRLDAGQASGLRLNLFFNPERRSVELAQIDAEILSQQESLQEIVDLGITVDDRKSLKRDYYFFNAAFDPGTQTVSSFTPSRDLILRTRTTSGFYANITSGLSLDPLEAVSIYGLKYDQEKFLRQFRSLLDFRPRAGWTESAGHGLQLLTFVGLLLHTYILHAIRTAPSRLPWRSVMEILDEMSSAACTRAGDGTCVPAPLSEEQRRIISSLGF